jgi:hypothetical protein
MRYRPALYLSLTGIAAVSIAAASYLAHDEIVRTLAALPFVGALFAALFQILRDHSSFEKERLAQAREHAFIVAATSHMSKVVFDKHVEFSEAYLKALQDLLSHLFTEGPKKTAREHLGPLYEARRTYRLWISPAVAERLDEFEMKVAQMAGSLGLWEARRARYETSGEKHLDKAYELFSEITNMVPDGGGDAASESKKSHGYALVIEHLQNVLGIGALTTLRDTIVRNASGKQ